MDVTLIESKYADLKRAFEQDKIGVDEYQMAVDDLRTQDDYGRYWIIGAETGEWYYYDGVEWISADPNEADTLPFVDENGVYWMLGQDTGEWYFYDGESWVRPETEPARQEPSPATPAQEQTQYYEDEQGRYWAKGAKSGQWYYYDETGWHKGDDLPEAVPPAAVPDYRPSYQRPAQPDYTQTVPFQPIQPSPGYLHQQTPMQAAVQRGEQPAPQPQQPAPQPQVQPEYTKPVAPQVQPQEPPQPSQTAYTQPVSPQQPQPTQGPVTPPAQAQLEAGVWYYSDGEQWLRYQDTPQTQAEIKEETPSVEDQLEANVWYYFDGEQWLAYQDVPDELEELTEEAAEPVVKGRPQARQDEEDIPEGDVYFEDDELLFADNEIEIDDLDDFVEVIEVDEDDIIDLENDELVEAEFQVEILKPGQPEPPVPAAAPVIVEAASPAEERLTTQPVTPASAPAQSHEPVPMEFASTHEKADAKPKVAPQPQPAPKASPVQVVRALPMWLWTSLGGITTLIIAGLLIVGIVYLLNNREKGVALITAQLTPTLPAAVSQTTPTPASTPTPTATVPPTATSVPLATYTSNYFGMSMKYPAGWVFKEDDDLVIFAPSARALDRTALAGASLWISLADNSGLTELLADNLEEFSPISETLSEGIMNIGRQSWASAQVRFDSETMGTEVIALVASTVINDRGYTLIAAAPASEWEDYKPLFQYAIDSFEFSSQSVAAAPSDATDGSTPEAETASQTPTATATPTKSAAAEPVIYVVQSGDTLGGIAYRYDVSVADLVKANGLAGESAIISIGQELIIPQEGVEVAAITATATPKAENTPKGTATSATTVTPTAAGSEATVTPKPTAEPTATTAPATTTLSGRIVYPAFSTDILSFNVWSTKTDGSDPLIVAGNGSQPHYSTDGSLFAYRSWSPNQRGIYFMDLVGGRQGLLTGFIEDSLPAWYNDGTLVFTSRREGDRVPRLFRVGQEIVNGYSLGFISDYVDTLADNRLVARGCSVSGDCGLWVLLPDGSGETKISNFSSDTAPAGKPQGGRIALMSLDRGSAGNWEIWTINEDGTDAVRLTEDGANDGLPTWSPDGNSIAFVSDRGGVWAIWAMNADGSNQRKLFNMQGPPDGQVLHDVPNSKGWLEERIDWIP